MHRFKINNIVRYTGNHEGGEWKNSPVINKLFIVVAIQNRFIINISCYKEKNQYNRDCCKTRPCATVYSDNVEKLTLKNICRTL